ncbi:MAG: 30S ribosomal protein S13 [Candidatus Pacearchaeota archaeon]|jgi:small subunit ribosomal protein S13
MEAKTEINEEKKQAQKPVYKNPNEKKYEGRLVRIVSEDIEGEMTVYAGLTKIKGVSWGISNAICKTLGIEKRKKIGSLTPEEIKKISEFIKNPKIPIYLLNRRKDFETGIDKHVSGTDLELQKEFDIKRLKKIKSYRGIRHGAGLPVRGQRTKAHFRKNKSKGAGIKKKGEKKERVAKPYEK